MNTQNKSLSLALGLLFTASAALADGTEGPNVQIHHAVGLNNTQQALRLYGAELTDKRKQGYYKPPVINNYYGGNSYYGGDTTNISSAVRNNEINTTNYDVDVDQSRHETNTTYNETNTTNYDVDVDATINVGRQPLMEGDGTLNP